MSDSSLFQLKELHIHILRLLYVISQPLTQKAIIDRFSRNNAEIYLQKQTKSENKITDAILYAAIKYLENEEYLERKDDDEDQQKNQEVQSRNNPPKYKITSKGEEIVRQSLSLNIQILLGFFISTFFREKEEKLRQIGLADNISIGIIGPKIPAGQSILNLFTELFNAQKIFYFDLDPLIVESPESGRMGQLERIELSNKTQIEFRKCSRDSTGNILLDIGNEQLDFVISMMLLSNFPDIYQNSLHEINRILKPGSFAIIQEIAIRESILFWLISRFSEEETAIFPPIFVNMIQHDTLEKFFSIKDIDVKMKQIFSAADVEYYQEIKLYYAFKGKIKNEN